MLRIGLDIDDVLGDFMGWYKRRFECDKYPHRLKEHIITRNVQKILRTDKSFWIGLPVISKPDFEPTLYCTKRVNPKKWTKLWLRLNNFPDKPVYQLFSQSGNKADLIKGRVDVFIDDSSTGRSWTVISGTSAGASPWIVSGSCSAVSSSLPSGFLRSVALAFPAVTENAGSCTVSVSLFLFSAAESGSHSSSDTSISILADSCGIGILTGTSTVFVPVRSSGCCFNSRANRCSALQLQSNTAMTNIPIRRIISEHHYCLFSGGVLSCRFHCVAPAFACRRSVLLPVGFSRFLDLFGVAVGVFEIVRILSFPRFINLAGALRYSATLCVSRFDFPGLVAFSCCHNDLNYFLCLTMI